MHSILFGVVACLELQWQIPTMVNICYYIQPLHYIDNTHIFLRKTVSLKAVRVHLTALTWTWQAPTTDKEIINLPSLGMAPMLDENFWVIHVVVMCQRFILSIPYWKIIIFSQMLILFKLVTPNAKHLWCYHFLLKKCFYILSSSKQQLNALWDGVTRCSLIRRKEYKYTNMNRFVFSIQVLQIITFLQYSNSLI